MEEKGRIPTKTDSVRFSIGYVYDEFMKYRQRRVARQNYMTMLLDFF